MHIAFAIVLSVTGSVLASHDCLDGYETCETSNDVVNMLQLNAQDASDEPPRRQRTFHSKPFTQHREGFGIVPPRGKIQINEDGVMNTYWLPGAKTIDDHTAVEYSPPFRFYLMKEYSTVFQNSTKFYKLNLIGKTFSVDIDFGSDGAGCGCNLNFYLVDMPVTFPGRDNDYYCDAQCFDNVGCCVEFDMNEGNMFAQQITNHACTKDYSDHPDWYCNKWGSPVDRTTTDEFGPGKKIDSRKPFTFHQEFRVDSGDLVIVTRIVQGDEEVTKTMGPSEQMNSMWYSLEKGLAFVTGYWSSRHMNWLDGDACGESSVEHCSKTPAYIRNWRITTGIPDYANLGQCRRNTCAGDVMDGWCSRNKKHCAMCGPLARWCGA